MLEIGYPAALVLFGIFHRRKLTESGKMLFQAYLSYWNKQYGTNYMTGAGTEMRYTYMLAFLLAVVVLLSLMFRYVTGVRLVLLIPDITALSVALLVNARLGWSGIALFFVGTVLVSAAPWTHMDVRVSDGRTNVWMQLLSYAAAGVFAVILVSVSSYAFSAGCCGTYRRRWSWSGKGFTASVFKDTYSEEYHHTDPRPCKKKGWVVQCPGGISLCHHSDCNFTCSNLSGYDLSCSYNWRLYAFCFH